MSERIVCNDNGGELREEIVRCRDCSNYEDGGYCHYFASYEQIAGGDEYRKVLAEVMPDGFCKWAERREQ